jgi:hypothetical protein
MRKRMIHEDFWTDAKITECSFPARLLYIGTWQYADDEGMFVVDLKNFKMQLFPDQKFPIESCWQELVDHGFFRFGKIDGLIIAQIRHFKRFQRISRPTPSKLLPLVTWNEDSLSHHGSLSESSLSTHGVVTEDSLNAHGVLTEDSCLIETNIKEEKVNGVTHITREERFKAFYNVYPIKRGKEDAWKAFAKINPDDALLAIMIRSINAWSKSDAWSRDAGKYIPHPATWLSGRRWEDELPGESPRTPFERKELPL